MLNKKKIKKQYEISTGHIELEDTMEFNIVPPLEKKVKKSQVWHAVFSVFMPESSCSVLLIVGFSATGWMIY
jgi:hypothetical protein